MTRTAAPRRRANPSTRTDDAAAMAAGAHVVRYLRLVAEHWQATLDRADRAFAERSVALHEVRRFFSGHRRTALGDGEAFRMGLVEHAAEIPLQAAYARAAFVLREAAQHAHGDAATTLRALADYAQTGKVPPWAQ